MFARIAQRYRLLNTCLSLGRDHVWRRRAAELAAVSAGDKALDVCCGTGDLTRMLAAAVGASGLVVGVDFCEEMLELAQRSRGGSAPAWLNADALSLPFQGEVFDCVTVAFGIRNTADPEAALHEMTRVTRRGGRVVVLEFGLPRDGCRRRFVRWYEERLVPFLGGILSQREAYEYLSRSISAFVTPEEMRAMMGSAGLRNVASREMHLGSVYAHVGTKP